MPSFQAQAVVQALQLVFVLAGGALLLRALALPDVRRRWFQTNRLAHWHVSPAEVGLLVVLIFLFGLTGQLTLYSSFAGSLKGHPDEKALLVLLTGAGFHGIALLGWPVWHHLRGMLRGDFDSADVPAPADASKPRRAAFPVAVGTLLCALPAILALQWGWLALLRWFGQPVEPQEIIAIFANIQSPWIMAGLVVMACVVAPINEELLFRHGLYRFSRQRFGRAIALAASSLLFGVSHANLAGVVPLAVLGAALALAYEKSGDVRVPILAHALFNLNTVCLLMLGVTA